MQIAAPVQKLTTTLQTIALSVRTLAGQSPVASVIYAGIPRVTRVINPRSAITLNGAVRHLGPGRHADPDPRRRLARPGLRSGPLLGGGPRRSNGTDYRYQSHGSSELDADTVGQGAGLVDVRVCTVTACSTARNADRLWLYAPGDPAVTSVTPRSGPPPAARTRRSEATISVA